MLLWRTPPQVLLLWRRYHQDSVYFSLFGGPMSRDVPGSRICLSYFACSLVLTLFFVHTLFPVFFLSRHSSSSLSLPLPLSLSLSLPTSVLPFPSITHLPIRPSTVWRGRDGARGVTVGRFSSVAPGGQPVTARSVKAGRFRPTKRSGTLGGLRAGRPGRWSVSLG